MLNRMWIMGGNGKSSWAQYTNIAKFGKCETLFEGFFPRHDIFTISSYDINHFMQDLTPGTPFSNMD